MTLSSIDAQRMTHKELTLIGARWLRTRCPERCPVVFPELVSMSMETPDVIGFNHVHSVVIEVKTSRRDYQADKKKPFRRHPEQGMGSFRMYLCPAGLINPAELPEKWGLLWVGLDGKVQVPKPIFIGNCNSTNPNRFLEKNERHERAILYSALRRIARTSGNPVVALR